MKRLHVHIKVNDLDEAVGFYSALFGVEPTKIKPDYAKWMLEDPLVNFSITTRSEHTGFAHLGIQVTEEAEANAIVERLAATKADAIPELATTCCYARSDKHWVNDPTGVSWEIFKTYEDAEIYAEDRSKSAAEQGSTCCMPTALAGG